jgi:hypothetical protein
LARGEITFVEIGAKTVEEQRFYVIVMKTQALKIPLRGWADWVLAFLFDGYYLHVY